MLSASRWNRGKKFTGCNRPTRRRVTKLYDWFALVNKYFRAKIMRTSLPLTEIWPISDRFIKHKYYCITVHYRTVCTSENRLGQTVQTGQQTLGHLELFSDFVRWPTPNWIPEVSTFLRLKPQSYIYYENPILSKTSETDAVMEIYEPFLSDIVTLPSLPLFKSYEIWVLLNPLSWQIPCPFLRRLLLGQVSLSRV